MKYASIAILTLTLLGCGGGGGGGGGGGVVLLTPQESANLAQVMLQNCGTPEINAIFDDLEPIRDLLSDQTPPPPDFEVTDVRLAPAEVDWSVDIDGNGTPDLTGTLRIRNQNGDPVFPTDLEAIIGQPLDIQSALGTIDDGTRLIFEFSATDPVPVDGSLTAVVDAGDVATAEGQGTALNGPCQTSLQFAPIAFANLEGDYPVATMDLAVQSTDGSLQGTVTMDGSKFATAEVTVSGGQGQHTFMIDLDTGVVTLLVIGT